MHARGNVLILDGMWNKSLAAARSLGSKGLSVTVGERTRLATALFSRYCTKRMIYPSPIRREEEFLSVLEKEVSRVGYDVVFPMEWVTQALLTSALMRPRLERHTRIPFIDAEVASNVNDKSFLMRHAISQGIEVPRTCFVEDIESVSKLSHNLAYPVLVKPRVSSGSRGIAVAENATELCSLYTRVHARYPFPIIQERIPSGGDALGVGLLLNFQSEIKAGFVYKRIREYPVGGGPSTLRESVKREDVLEIAAHLMTSLKWVGVAHVEFKVDPRDGRPRLLEVNPRFWGSLQLAVESGVDFPFLLYMMAVDGDIEAVRDYRVGVRCRWLIPGDLLHFMGNPNRFHLKPSFFSFDDRDDIMSWRDPLPTIGRILSAFTLVLDKDMRDLTRRDL